MIRELLLPATTAGWCRLPAFNCVLADSESDIAPLNERSVVFGPVADAVLRLGLGVDTRFHEGES